MTRTPAIWDLTCTNVSYTVQKSIIAADVHTDVATYGLNGVNATNSTFGSIDLPPPVLNISAPYQNSECWKSIQIDTCATAQLLWGYENKTYHLGYLQQNGKCQATSVRLHLLKLSLFG